MVGSFYPESVGVQLQKKRKKIIPMINEKQKTVETHTRTKKKQQKKTNKTTKRNCPAFSSFRPFFFVSVVDFPPANEVAGNEDQRVRVQWKMIDAPVLVDFRPKRMVSPG